MTTAEGGMVFARDPDVLERVKQMRTHGMSSGTMERLAGHELTYDVTMLGYNYRMDELRAAVGLVQLRNLGYWNERRAALTGAYRRLLHKYCPDIVVPFSIARPPSSHHVMPVILPVGTDRRLVADCLREAGIRTTVHYPAVHQFTWYESRFPDVRLPLTEEFCRCELTLPLHPKMGESDVETVVRALAQAINR
jgi:dTDP-4-amino-4,6-dideoxygalactose transaminase